MNDEGLREELERLRTEVDALHRRIDDIEASIPDDQPAESDWTNESRSDRLEPIDHAESTTVDEVEKDGEPAANGNAGGSGTASRTVEALGDERDWELALGVRWLGLVGALALVVGVVFFVRLAIEIGLLGPFGRVAVGTLSGLALFGGGRYAAGRQGYVRWGRIAAGAGLAISYFSTYAAYGFESYREAIGTPLWAVLVALTLLIAATAALSIRDGAPLVVGEAFLLGYVTATLSTDAATVVVTPVYVLLLAGGLVSIAAIRPWSRLVVSSTFASYGVLLLWLIDLDPPAAAVGIVAGAAFLLYLVGGYVLRTADDETVRNVGRSYRIRLTVLTVANAGFAAALLEIAFRDALPESAVAGVGTIAVAAALAGAYAVTDRRPVRRDAAAAASSVALLAAGIAMAAGTFATTLGVLGVVCGAVVLSRTVDAPAFRIGAHVVAGALVLKLLAVDASRLAAFDASEPIAALTGRPVAFALSIGVFYALAWRLSAASLTGAERRIQPLITGGYAIAATGLGVLALALELSGVEVSIAWISFGFVLLGIGLWIDRQAVRGLGIAVLGLATVKVFLFDTRDLDTVARTLSFLVLGAVLLVASYVYSRSRDDIDVGLELPKRGGA